MPTSERVNCKNLTQKHLLRLFNRVKPIYLYNIQTTVSQAVLVGNFSIDGYSIDYENILLPDGNNTVSRVVPQNPNLENGSIAVSFGLLIAILVFVLLAFALLFVYRKHKFIRRDTPNITFLILIGLFLVNVSGILICMDVTTAICWISLAFYNLGFGIVLGGIIAKEYRIYRIFSNRSASAVVIKDLTLFLVVGGVSLYFCLITMTYYLTGYQDRS